MYRRRRTRDAVKRLESTDWCSTHTYIIQRSLHSSHAREPIHQKLSSPKQLSDLPLILPRQAHASFEIATKCPGSARTSSRLVSLPIRLEMKGSSLDFSDGINVMCIPQVFVCPPSPLQMVSWSEPSIVVTFRGLLWTQMHWVRALQPILRNYINNFDVYSNPNSPYIKLVRGVTPRGRY